MSRAICSLTGESTDAAAWDKLFRHLNRTRGKGDVPYRPGEKVAVKPNWVGMISTGPFPRLAPDETLTVTYAIVAAEDSLRLLEYSKTAQVAYNDGFSIPAGPPSPLRYQPPCVPACAWWCADCGYLPGIPRRTTRSFDRPTAGSGWSINLLAPVVFWSRNHNLRTTKQQPAHRHTSDSRPDRLPILTE